MSDRENDQTLWHMKLHYELWQGDPSCVIEEFRTAVEAETALHHARVQFPFSTFGLTAVGADLDDDESMGDV